MSSERTLFEIQETGSGWCTEEEFARIFRRIQELEEEVEAHRRGKCGITEAERSAIAAGTPLHQHRWRRHVVYDGISTTVDGVAGECVCRVLASDYIKELKDALLAVATRGTLPTPCWCRTIPSIDEEHSDTCRYIGGLLSAATKADKEIEPYPERFDD